MCINDAFGASETGNPIDFSGLSPFPRERHGLQDAVARVLKSPRAKLVFLKKSLGERLICEGAGP